MPPKRLMSLMACFCGAEILNLAAAGRPEDYLYLADPAGRMVMRFAPEVTIYEIRSDLKRLLKLSKGWRQVK